MNLNISEEWLRKHSDIDEGCISVGGLYVKAGLFKSYNAEEMEFPTNPNPVVLTLEKEKELRERMEKLIRHSENKQEIIDDAIKYLKGIPLNPEDPKHQYNELTEKDVQVMLEVSEGKRATGKYKRTPKRINNATNKS